MKRTMFFILMAACIAAFSFAQTAGTGVFRQEGIASWYGSEFDGKPTASGEIFNSGLYTAAHPTLPFGTVLMVTNKQNNHRVAVRVNDRGPFVAARIIDLSRAAGEVLDMLITGTAPVLVEQAPVNTALGPAGEAPIAETAPNSQPLASAQGVTVPLEPVTPAETVYPFEVPVQPYPPVSETPVQPALTPLQPTQPMPISP
ncbi:MAG: septal ring lytic transglycosylase RlpA family protein, partial [Treponema sp.]|nr:septal ring lytic transglycosylase RlpA family protein [Treponema sp.]